MKTLFTQKRNIIPIAYDQGKVFKRFTDREKLTN